jgi:hypothetical protein
VVPKATREFTISNAMKEEFILEATTSASGRRTHLAVIEYREGVQSCDKPTRRKI